MRSNLTVKFNLGVVNKFQKSLRENDKELKKKNLSRYMTLDVINRKGIPDIDDCIQLIKLGNNNCEEEQAYDILNRWLEDENNRKRGLAGAFAELCKDYSLDIPVDSLFKEQCDEIESSIQGRLNLQTQLNGLFDKITNLKNTLENNKNNEDTDDKNEITNDSDTFTEVMEI